MSDILLNKFISFVKFFFTPITQISYRPDIDLRNNKNIVSLITNLIYTIYISFNIRFIFESFTII
jgi:hypothetical protein